MRSRIYKRGPYRRSSTVLKRLEALSIPEPNSGCWLWTAALTTTGYGCFRENGATQTASRASFEVHNGPIPDGLYVCHRCDNRLCVNPAHLFLGTHQDNMDDKKAKGRQRNGITVGEANKNSKLTSADARIICASREKAADLAARYGVHRDTIDGIRQGRRWRHATADLFAGAE